MKHFDVWILLCEIPWVLTGSHLVCNNNISNTICESEHPFNTHTTKCRHQVVSTPTSYLGGPNLSQKNVDSDQVLTVLLSFSRLMPI
jgi:hypothetical protein